MTATTGQSLSADSRRRSWRIGITYGVYGVPETYVIDKQGVIRYKQIGPVDDDVVTKTILPLVKELRNK